MAGSTDQIIIKILEITTKIMERGSQSDMNVIRPIYTSTCQYFQGNDSHRDKQLDFYNKVVMYQDALMEYHGKFRTKFIEIHDLITEIGNRYNIFNQRGKRKISDIHGLLFRLSEMI
jgi:hypothetical protein